MLDHPRRFRRLKWAPLLVLLGSSALLAARGGTSPFVDECDAAMTAMMHAMRVTSAGDADADFEHMMVAHHEGAIAMAKAELRYGKNEQLRRLAQEMIITQQQEIVAMRMALADSAHAHTGASR
jgi:uncharacterized protein (DUF305 family)